MDEKQLDEMTDDKLVELLFGLAASWRWHQAVAPASFFGERCPEQDNAKADDA